MQKIAREEFIMTVGERIQDLRKKKDYSQEKLAEYLNMSRQAVAKWEQNICEPNLDCLAKMADLFEVDLDYLIRGKALEEVKTDNVVREKETVIIKEKDSLLDKKDIVLLITLITSTAVFIGLFIYALLNPILYKSSISFIWWYARFWILDGTWFRLLVLISAFGIIFSLHTFLKRQKNK